MHILLGHDELDTLARDCRLVLLNVVLLPLKYLLVLPNLAFELLLGLLNLLLQAVSLECFLVQLLLYVVQLQLLILGSANLVFDSVVREVYNFS